MDNPPQGKNAFDNMLIQKMIARAFDVPVSELENLTRKSVLNFLFAFYFACKIDYGDL